MIQVNIASDVHHVGKVADQIVEDIDGFRGEVQEKMDDVGAQVAKLQEELRETRMVATELVLSASMRRKACRRRSQSI